MALLAGCAPIETERDPDPPPPPDTGSVAGVGDLTRMTLAENQRSVLSPILTWQTEEPLPIEVEITTSEGPLRYSDATPKTEHEVVLVGLHQETTYAIVARSGDLEGQAEWTTGTLPEHIVVAEVPTRVDSAMQPGWTLTNVSNRGLETPPTAVIYDPSGQPVWYRIHGLEWDNRGDVDTRLLPGNQILIGPSGPAAGPAVFDLAGEFVWQGPRLDAPEFLHHHWEPTADGWLGLQKVSMGDVQGDKALLVDDDGNELWSWLVQDHVDFMGLTGDQCHANSVSLFDDFFLFNCRNINRVHKVDRGTGDVIWALGLYGDFSGDPDADEPFTKWQHEPELQPNGNLLVYDNGNATRPHGRVVEYALDETAMTSTVVWEFPGDYPVDSWYLDDWYSFIWGDADRQPNGNTLVTAGTRDAGDISRIFEVTADGEVVWELILPPLMDTTGIYRAERIQLEGWTLP